MHKKLRLRDNRDFKRVYKKPKAYYNRDFTVLIRDNKTKNPRFGFSIGKSVGKAVVRNKLKRRLREIVRLNYSNINNVDIVIIPKKHTADFDYKRLEKSFKNVIKKAFQQKKIYYVK